MVHGRRNIPDRSDRSDRPDLRLASIFQTNKVYLPTNNFKDLTGNYRLCLAKIHSGVLEWI